MKELQSELRKTKLGRIQKPETDKNAKLDCIQKAGPKPLQPSTIVTGELLKSWSGDPRLFFSAPDTPSEARLGAIYDETVLYDDTVQIQGRHDIDAIRLRFRKLFYFDLLNVLNPAGSGRVTSGVYNQLAQLIARSSRETNVQRIEAQLEAWVKAGRRYHKLSATFGTAILFVLPVLID